MKKLLSFVMVVAMLMSVCAFGVFAADEPTMTVSSATVNKGEEFTLTVDVANNPGFTAATLSFEYDKEALELVSVENTADFDGSTTMAEKFVWLAKNDVTANGTFLKLNFKVLDNAKGGNYTVDAKYVEGDICNYDEKDVNFVVTAGKVTVFDPTAPTMTVGTVYGKVGEQIEVPVVVSNNPGFTAATLTFVYDNEALKLDEVVTGADFDASTTMAEKFVWLAKNDVKANGTFVTLKFTVLKGVDGESTPVSVTYAEGDICNYNEEDVNFQVVAGKVIFGAEPVPETTAPVTEPVTEPETEPATEPATTAKPDNKPNDNKSPATADASVVVAAVALAAGACFVATKKRK